MSALYEEKKDMIFYRRRQSFLGKCVRIFRISRIWSLKIFGRFQEFRRQFIRSKIVAVSLKDSVSPPHTEREADREEKIQSPPTDAHTHTKREREREEAICT
jgi:hypothetical protein